MKPSSLRLRLLLAAGVFVAVATALAAIGLTLLFERHVTRWVSAELATQMDQLIAGIDRGDGGQIAVVRAPGDARFAQPLSGLYWEVVVEPSGPVYRSRSLWDFEIVLPPEATVDDSIREHHAAGPGGKDLYLVQRRIELPQRLDRKTARVAVALDSAELDAAVWRFMAALIPFLLFLAGLLIAASWAQVTLGLKPLKSVREKLNGIAAGSATRLGAGFPDEVQPLADELDALLAARAKQLEKAKGRAADLAHGLKTPLQVLAGDVRRLEAKGETAVAGDIAKVAAAMQRHVDRELARARRATADARASADVATVIDSVVRVVRRGADGERLGWRVAVPPLPPMRIDAADLAEAVGNLVENAARHAATRVTIEAESTGTMLVVRVLDDGPGIPADQRDAALERGRRLDTATGTGTGLGLSIVTDIVEAWGGRLTFADVPAGGARPDFGVALHVPVQAAPTAHTRVPDA